jgi:hypothetical protein
VVVVPDKEKLAVVELAELELFHLTLHLQVL